MCTHSTGLSSESSPLLLLCSHPLPVFLFRRGIFQPPSGGTWSNAPLLDIGTSLSLKTLSLRSPISVSMALSPSTNDVPLSYHDRRASLTGISLNPIAPGEVKSSKYLTDTKMIVEMFAWALENAAPANILLISRDLDFWPTLEALKKEGYNILLGTSMSDLCAPLVAVAETAWSYLDLLAGDPPDKGQ